MTYEYSFDDTYVGNYRWRKDDYILIQDSFSLLLNEIQRWNVKALEHGATKTPYEEEEDCIEEMIAYGEPKLANQCRYIEIHGISVGSLRYIKAALFLVIRREEERLAQKIEDRWPDGVISSLREKKTALKNIADKITQEPSDILWEFIPKEQTDEIHDSSNDRNTSMEWDVFICHASEDKEEFVRPLAISLISRDLKVWYDELTLTLGDSLRRSIDRGLAHSRYGIVVISPNFLRKEWPQKELDGLAALEVNGRKVILPVWHQIDVSGVREYSPTLADRVATSSEKGIEKVVEDILKALDISAIANSIPEYSKDMTDQSEVHLMARVIRNEIIKYLRPSWLMSKLLITELSKSFPKHNVVDELHRMKEDGLVSWDSESLEDNPRVSLTKTKS